MELLQELITLTEAKEQKDTAPIDSISLMLFKKRSGPVRDLKRSKEADFVGVANEKSTLKSADGKHLKLTFDNSTDSGEFELDSLTPLQIVRDSDLDKDIKRLYHKHDVSSKKKIGYISKGDQVYVREIHLGKELSSKTVRLVAELVDLLQRSE